MKRETIDYLIKKPYNLNILNYCDGKHSIKDISELVQLTYKTTFLRIKELEKNGIIKIDIIKNIGEKSKVWISKDYKDYIQESIKSHNSSEQRIKGTFEYAPQVNSNKVNKETRKTAIEFLEILSKDRFIDPYFLDTKYIDMMDDLVNAGMMKVRWEITKKGKSFLIKNN